MIMTSDGQIDVLVYGLGAIGSFYAFILSKDPRVRLSVVARSNYEPVKSDVLRSASEANMQFDFIVCAHKAINQDAVPAELEAAVDEKKTTIVIIQNGVGNEEPFRDFFPQTTIISCVTWTGAIQPRPGHFGQIKSEDMQMGLYPNGSADGFIEKQRLDEFSALLREGKTIFQVVPNIQVQRWEKVVWNAAWNSITTLTLLDTHTWLKSSKDAMPLTRQLMQEVINVARKCNVPLENELIDRLIEKILSMPPIGSSMQNDYKAGRPMEVDIILGTPYRKGKELGVPTPILEVIYVILTGVNLRLKKGTKIAVGANHQ